MDQRMQKAYKTLVRFYEQCALVKTAIEERGQISRNIDELTDEVSEHLASEEFGCLRTRY